MMARTYYNLKKVDGCRFYLRKEALLEGQIKVKSFLESEDFFKNEQFARMVMFSHEIKANNLIEGYGDDILDIKNTIENTEVVTKPEKRARILNLYNAYKYILSNKNINKESLRELYKIMSDNLLMDCDKNRMGDYYRNGTVYILHGGRLDTVLEEGVPVSRLEEFMEMYFDYVNFDYDNDDEMEIYIKSQIMHFYFVYIHPYFDVNGRTSRTVAMWYLLNKESYPYIIFNRGISFKGSIYDKTIRRSLMTNDLTYFIELMLETLLIELEKEYVLTQISNTCPSKMKTLDFQSMLYFLSMKGPKTIFDFAAFYNRYDERKDLKEIYEKMICPLLEKRILDVSRSTKKEVNGIRNKELVLRPLEIDKTRISHLDL